MNHRLYQDWLFEHLDPAGDTLNEQQIEDLKAHLLGCDACQALANSLRQVEVKLRRAPELEPAPGFAMRWQARLQADQVRLHRRQSLAALAFGIGAAGLLFGSLLVLAWPWLGSPQVLFWSWAYRMITLASYMDVVREFMAPLFQAAAGKVSFTGWVLLAGILSELAVLWVVSFRLVTNPRRVSQ